jgi:hypothetical protein
MDRHGLLFPALDEALADRLDEMARGPARAAAAHTDTKRRLS